MRSQHRYYRLLTRLSVLRPGYQDVDPIKRMLKPIFFNFTCCESDDQCIYSALYKFPYYHQLACIQKIPSPIFVRERCCYSIYIFCIIILLYFSSLNHTERRSFIKKDISLKSLEKGRCRSHFIKSYAPSLTMEGIVFTPPRRRSVSHNLGSGISPIC